MTAAASRAVSHGHGARGANPGKAKPPGRRWKQRLNGTPPVEARLMPKLEAIPVRAMFLVAQLSVTSLGAAAPVLIW